MHGGEVGVFAATLLHTLLPISLLSLPALASCSTQQTTTHTTEQPKPSPTIQSLTTYLATPRATRTPINQQPFATTPLSKAEAAQAAELLWADHLSLLRETRAPEWAAKSITLDGKTMRFDFRTFGEKPKNGRSLFISMHGGGGAPAKVNDQQWQNQIGLYTPAEGVYLAPRAPTDTWNLWHEAHIDPLLDRIIEDAVALEGVDPDRVYLMGYSAGGDGVYQLAPRMADRFAAASMMAGHPNEASPLGLRNLPFAIHVGANDSAYKRNDIAREWGQKLDDLQKADPDPAHAYTHVAKLHEGRGHWMNREDAEAVAWMAQHTRNPFPRRVVWHQDDVTHDRFYWLGVPKGQAKAGADVVASVEGQTVKIESATITGPLCIYLSDALVDMDQKVMVTYEGRTVMHHQPRRTVSVLAESLIQRPERGINTSGTVVVDLLKN